MKSLALTALAALIAGPMASPTLAACTMPVGVEISADDAARLSRIETSRMRGLASALTAESGSERGTLSALFAAGLAPVAAEALPGRYRCRTIKAGGGLPLTVYSWFRCEIAAEGDGFAISKTTGSQNFSGTLYPGGAAFAYRGASNYGDEAPRAYGDKADENQVGCLSGVVGSARHYVLELPEPLLESLHDIIELQAAD